MDTTSREQEHDALLLSFMCGYEASRSLPSCPTDSLRARYINGLRAAHDSGKPLDENAQRLQNVMDVIGEQRFCAAFDTGTEQAKSLREEGVDPLPEQRLLLEYLEGLEQFPIVRILGEIEARLSDNPAAHRSVRSP